MMAQEYPPIIRAETESSDYLPPDTVGAFSFYRRIEKIHLVKYKGETPFFRHRKRNKLVNERFRAKVGIAGKILGNPKKPKPNEEKSNSFNAQSIDALMKDL